MKKTELIALLASILFTAPEVPSAAAAVKIAANIMRAAEREVTKNAQAN